MSDRKDFQCPSFWPSAGFADHIRPLAADAVTEVCIVGGGVVGLTVAYELLRQGVEVLVVDDGQIGGGESVRSTAHLTNALDRGYRRLRTLHDGVTLAEAARSHQWAVNRIEEIVQQEGIGCEFERLEGYLVASGSEPGALEAEYRACVAAGLAVERMTLAAGAASLSGPALRFPAQAQLHPSKFLKGLAYAILRSGGRIVNYTRVSEIARRGGVELRTENGWTIHAKHLVLATGAPLYPAARPLLLKQAAYRSYVIAALVRRDSMPRGLFWDLADPFHYVRHADISSFRSRSHRASHDLLLIGGEDHRTGNGTDSGACYQRLEAWAREHFPVLSVLHRWSGQLYETADGFGYIGRLRPDSNAVLVATGDCGNGFTYAAIAGKILTDLLSERANPWSELYSPTRPLPRRALSRCARENLHAVSRYSRWLTSMQLRSREEELEPLSGKVIVRPGREAIAVFRDEDGNLHRFSAACPPLGSLVRWNGAEQSWECPSFGSRFTALGEVVNGPAATGLRRLDRATHAADHSEPLVISSVGS